MMTFKKKIQEKTNKNNLDFSLTNFFHRIIIDLLHRFTDIFDANHSCSSIASFLLIFQFDSYRLFEFCSVLDLKKVAWLANHNYKLYINRSHNFFRCALSNSNARARLFSMMAIEIFETWDRQCHDRLRVHWKCFWCKINRNLSIGKCSIAIKIYFG